MWLLNCFSLGWEQATLFNVRRGLLGVFLAYSFFNSRYLKHEVLLNSSAATKSRGYKSRVGTGGITERERERAHPCEQHPPLARRRSPGVNKKRLRLCDRRSRGGCGHSFSCPFFAGDPLNRCHAARLSRRAWGKWSRRRRCLGRAPRGEGDAPGGKGKRLPLPLSIHPLAAFFFFFPSLRLSGDDEGSGSGKVLGLQQGKKLGKGE